MNAQRVKQVVAYSLSSEDLQVYDQASGNKHYVQALTYLNDYVDTEAKLEGILCDSGSPTVSLMYTIKGGEPKTFMMTHHGEMIETDIEGEWKLALQSSLHYTLLCYSAVNQCLGKTVSTTYLNLFVDWLANTYDWLKPEEYPTFGVRASRKEVEANEFEHIELIDFITTGSERTDEYLNVHPTMEINKASLVTLPESGAYGKIYPIIKIGRHVAMNTFLEEEHRIVPMVNNQEHSPYAETLGLTIEQSVITPDTQPQVWNSLAGEYMKK